MITRYKRTRNIFVQLASRFSKIKLAIFLNSKQQNTNLKIVSGLNDGSYDNDDDVVKTQTRVKILIFDGIESKALKSVRAKLMFGIF